MQEIQITAMVPDNAQPCALPWTCKTCGASGTVVLSGVSVFALAEAAESSATLIANGIAKRPVLRPVVCRTRPTAPH